MSVVTAAASCLLCRDGALVQEQMDRPRDPLAHYTAWFIGGDCDGCGERWRVVDGLVMRYADARRLLLARRAA